MQDALRGNLERPACMQSNTKFVPAAEQCPPKPRGRKPKKTVEKESKHDGGRPSAAAAGFNTEGLSDEQVKDKIAKYYSTSNGQKEEKIEEVVPTKKRSRQRKSVEAEDEKKDQVEKTTVEDAPTKKRARDSKHVEEKVEKKGKVEKTTVEAAPTKKRPRGSKHVEQEKEGDETSKGKRSKKQVAKAENEAGVSSKGTGKDDASVLKRKKGSTGAKEEATTSVKRGKSKQSQKTEEEIKAEKKVAAKARVSRKSAAYHKAVKESKARGESKEDQVKAGKAATCRIF